MANNNKKYKVGKSKIQGKGVFSKQDLNPGDYIGKAHTINKLYTDYDFTDLGKNHNHSDSPNVQNVLIGNERHFVAIKPIKKGQEITTDYRLQPDLEQPEDFEQAKGGKKLTASKAKEILHDKSVHGHPLTDKQRKFFGTIAGGAAPQAQNGIEGTMGGLTDKGFNYNPAWGGAWKNGGWMDKYENGGNLQPPMAGAMQTVPMAQMGTSLPGSTGMMYARTAGAAPSEGPYAKKTRPSAQDGMTFYQHGLDWKPRNISRDGSSVNRADEYPLQKLDDLLNFINYNKPKAKSGGWLDKYK
jgi:hypothetical protein